MMNIYGILDLHGVGSKGARVRNVGALPAADINWGGKLVRVAGTNNVEDEYYICKKMGDNTYTWMLLVDRLSELVDDATHRLVTDTQVATWNAKATTAVVTTSANGLMSSTDKTKLDGISAGANKTTVSANNGNVKVDGADVLVYTHPANHPASVITQDLNNRFVTDTEKATWNAKATTAVVTTTVNGLMSSTDKTKLDGISAGANKTTVSANNGNVKVDGADVLVYTHPASHAPSIITQDLNNRFVTDAEKSTWNAKATTAIVTSTTNGLMTASDKNRLDTMSDYANRVAQGNTNGYIDIDGSSTQVYVHPDTHPASVVVQDLNNRFVTDTEKATWNAKATTDLATTLANGLMSSADKSKLDGIASGADAVADSTTNGNILINGSEVVVYTHPATHAGTMITEDATHRWFTDTERTKLNGIAAGADVVADSTTNGNILINGTETNIYTHPANHPPSIITQDASNRFCTDTEKSTWNAKASTAVATTAANGLMSAGDKVNLNAAWLGSNAVYGGNSSNSYMKFPNGLIFQWWQYTCAAGMTAYWTGYPLTFPYGALHVGVSVVATYPDAYASAWNWAANGCNVACNKAYTIAFFAIGT